MGPHSPLKSGSPSKQWQPLIKPALFCWLQTRDASKIKFLALLSAQVRKEARETPEGRQAPRLILKCQVISIPTPTPTLTAQLTHRGT